MALKQQRVIVIDQNHKPQRMILIVEKVKPATVYVGDPLSRWTTRTKSAFIPIARYTVSPKSHSPMCIKTISSLLVTRILLIPSRRITENWMN